MGEHRTEKASEILLEDQSASKAQIELERGKKFTKEKIVDFIAKAYFFNVLYVAESQICYNIVAIHNHLVNKVVNE